MVMVKAFRWQTGLLIILGLMIAVFPVEGGASGAVERTIRVEASSFQYSPAVLNVNHGDRVTLELVSTDVVHGIYIDGYDLEVVADPGQTRRLTFVADKEGSFRLRCSVTCGAFHPFMTGKLEVGQNLLIWRATALAVLAAAASLWLFRKTLSP